ncbi:DJ-1/PfpI family protein [Serratia inhibens]|uniref:DJ-1/PfpI family protein n=1 Tax=Serratia inhibens TaxID=2338073 RepID=UPI0008099463|nr:DJ-1/PfpI family protein [Serratia inhibens]ANS44703.1 Isonitrile hydratase [Serratia inhibens PRI-2C]
MERRDFIVKTILATATLAATYSSQGISSTTMSTPNSGAEKKKDPNAKTIAFVLFPNMTPLDIVGPVTMLQNHGFNVEYVYHDKNPVPTEINSLSLMPTATFSELNSADILCVTGTHNPFNAIADKKMLDWINTVGKRAEYVTSVCTGGIIIAAAGLLDGYKASTHWSFQDTLAALGAIPSDERVTVDRNRITGGGVTAGIDFGLYLLSLLKGKTTAELMQLFIQYDPHPPFNAGTPQLAGQKLTDQAKAITAAYLAEETPNYKETLAEAIDYKKKLSIKVDL